MNFKEIFTSILPYRNFMTPYVDNYFGNNEEVRGVGRIVGERIV